MSFINFFGKVKIIVCGERYWAWPVVDVKGKSEKVKKVIAMEVSVQSSNSNHSAKSELEKDISDLDVSDKKNGLNGSANINNLSSEKLNTLKKRISSCKTPNRTRETTKAKRVRFFRNGDKFWTGYLVAVSNERYK